MAYVFSFAFEACRERSEILERMAPRVRALFDAGLAAKEVGARLESESWASDRERRAI